MTMTEAHREPKPHTFPNMPTSTDTPGRPNIDTPRISANQLAEFAFSTPAKKLRITQDQKFGNPFSSPYYQHALTALLYSFQNGRYNRSALQASITELKATEPRSPNHAHKLRNNAEMLRHFLAIVSPATPPAGDHEIVYRNAYVVLDGVWISVRPEIVTRQSDSFCYAKLRFSKSRVSADASEIILLILLEFGRRQATEGMNFDIPNSRLVDCFASNVILGHNLPQIRSTQLRTALVEYRHLWASAEPPASGLAATA
jgi:hypothetical protein